MQQELLPDAGAAVALPPAEPSLALDGYDAGETSMGTCPECESPLEFADGA